MKYTPKQPAVLLLADGTVFQGRAIGKIGTTTGEICFNTGMTGYQEIYTDPSYYGQILLSTTSHIGNYGIHPEEAESESLKIEGLVCKKFTHTNFSRPRATQSIQTHFEEEGLVGISDVDTRAIVRHVRDKGAMNAVISSSELDVDKLKEILKEIPSMEGLELASKVTTAQPYFFGDPKASYKVSVLDIGVKKNILRCLAERDCYLQVSPMSATFDEITAWEPDGIMLSNGPGDPSAMPGVVNTVRQLLEADHAIFGICLGHQVLALANGLETYKMHNGHRGVNHPVKNLRTGKCEVTSQNHGFVVSMDSAEASGNIEVTHVHLNDGTLAGMKVKDRNAFSVQYHPESSAGPNDSRYLFETFIESMKTRATKGQPKVSERASVVGDDAA